jgi:NAD-dependent dihydropyrimidine dehydrogenase PreA subunit
MTSVSKLMKKVLNKYLTSVPNSSIAKSKYLPQIFEKLTTKKDLEILLTLPNNSKNVAKLLSFSEKEAAIALRDLYMRGFIWVEENTEDGPKYCFADVGILMDSVLFDPRYDKYGDEFFDIWKKYWNEEHIHMYQLDNTFRVLPVEEVIRGTKIIPYERVSQIIKKARRVAVQRCACRVRERRCSNPLETCISFDNLADYVISRDIGREISVEEALKIINDCEDHGLVHQTVNSDTPDIICNCCSCCCSFLRSILYYGKKAASVKSRYLAVFDGDKCASCKDLLCVEKCNFGGITARNGSLSIDPNMCWGCGLCARTCPKNAIRMKELRKPNHIPRSGEKAFPIVALKKG